MSPNTILTNHKRKTGPLKWSSSSEGSGRRFCFPEDIWQSGHIFIVTTWGWGCVWLLASSGYGFKNSYIQERKHHHILFMELIPELH